jgi:asparagine synthase (glutamine-hydrolysing)
MCGIIGSISLTPINKEQFLHACNIQAHRGPDDSGLYETKIGVSNIILGHQRLSIIDLSKNGGQPMKIGNHTTIFNGEIYNYLELKSELLSKGIKFTSSSDTEVVNLSIQFWGFKEALQKFNGMWAIAHLDEDKKKLFLSRDRFGEKPLYFFQNKNKFFFASEIKSILVANNRTFSINYDSVAAYLQQHLIDSSNHTFFEEINSLLPSCYMEIDLNHSLAITQEKKYWSPKIENDMRFHDGFLSDRIRDTFFDAVNIRLRSDVPVGILLSGGLDSSAITAAASLNNKNDISLLSVVSEDSKHDESKYVDLVSQYVKRNVIKVNVQHDAFDYFSKISDVTWMNDAPLGSFGNIAHYYMMQKAKENNIKVILSGQGGDELFCGYKKYVGFYLQELLSSKKFSKFLGTLSSFIINGTVINQFNFSEAKRYLSLFNDVDNDFLGERLKHFQPIVLGLMKNETVSGRQIRDMFSLSVPALNHFEDRMSMSLSREIRLPFLDYRLAEIMLNAPTFTKINKGWTKYALRQAMSNHLPKEILWRKDKKGFSIPQDSWIKNELRVPILKEYFNEDSYIFNEGLVSRSQLIKRFNSFASNNTHTQVWFRDIFAPFALEVFLRKFSNFISY